jgi:hypothetical protein
VLVKVPSYCQLTVFKESKKVTTKKPSISNDQESSSTMYRLSICRAVVYTAVVIWISVGDYTVDGFSDRPCGLDCSENGNCKVNDSGQDACECSYGWTGPKCRLPYETCDDTITESPIGARQCFNGGNCEKYTIEEDPEKVGQTGTRCNCQSLPTDTVTYAGHQCEFAAEQVCVRDAVHSTYSFCVNGGTCKEFVEFNEEHPLCDCPLGFGGMYCEFDLIAEDGGFFEAPVDTIEYVNIIANGIYGNETEILETFSPDDKKKLSPGMKFFVVLVVFFFCSIPCCYYYRRQRTKTATKSSSGDSAWVTNDTGKDSVANEVI